MASQIRIKKSTQTRKPDPNAGLDQRTPAGKPMAN